MLIKADFNDSISERLGDTGKVYWTEDEIDLIIKEALLTFGAISGYWKDQIIIETGAQQIYDLLDSSDVNALQFEHIETSLTYQDVIDWIDKDLIGYEEDDIIDIITNAINAFQSETKLVLAKSRFNILIGQNITISDDVLDIVAAYYINSSGAYSPLNLADENQVTLYNRNYTIDMGNMGRPRFYSINNLSLSIVDLFPKPNENGFLELIYVKGKSGVQTSASDCLIPNNLVPYLKYQAEFQIFNKDGDTNDPARAQYVNKRWQEGLLIGNNYSAIVNTKLNGVNKTLSSMKDFDNLRYGWLGDIETSIKKVNAVALAGYNILALNRQPINEHALLLEVISNAPIEEDEIDLRADYIPYLLDYCLHLANIKDGIACIQKTSIALDNFIKSAVMHNQYLQQRKISHIDLLQKSKYPLKQARIREQENAA